MNRDDLSTYLRRVSARVVDDVLTHPDRIRKVLFPSSMETVIDDEVLITIDGLGYFESAIPPSLRITLLGAPIGDIDLGGAGPARGFTPAEVRTLATHMTLLDPPRLAQSLRGVPLPPESPSSTELVAAYETMRAFILETAKAEAAMIVYWS